jgi:hypothetical protein
MTLVPAAMLPAAGFDVPVAGLLEAATRRLERQGQYARPLAKAGRRADALRGWLQEAAGCVVALARPQAALAPVDCRAVPGGIEIAGRVELDGEDLARLVSLGGTATAYLLTLGYAQADAFAWLQGDYGAHHVQSDLAGEVLFALGRNVHRRLAEASPGCRLRRVPIQTQAGCGQRRIWDAARVQALLGVFDGVNPGVSVTDTGCFQPLNSLLGLEIRLPPGVSPGPEA